ncbi:hypothetical protein SRHO_G00147020 [Serrasalmus rhombeus]
MLKELSPNLWDDDLDCITEFGYVISPELEMTVLPELLHGEAVNIDMAFMLYVARERGFLTEDMQCIISCMKHLELSVWHQQCSLDLVQKSLSERLKHSGGKMRMPLPTGLGKAVGRGGRRVGALSSVSVFSASKTAGLSTGLAPESPAPCPPERGAPLSALVRFLRYPDKEAVLQAAMKKRDVKHKRLILSGSFSGDPEKATRVQRDEKNLLQPTDVPWIRLSSQATMRL